MTRGRPSCGYAHNEAAEAKQRAKFFCYSVLNDRLKPCPMQAVDGASWSVASVANGCQASVIETHTHTYTRRHTPARFTGSVCRSISAVAQLVEMAWRLNEGLCGCTLSRQNPILYASMPMWLCSAFLEHFLQLLFRQIA